MEKIYQREFTIREDQLDAKGELRLFSLLRLAMDSSREHSNQLGLGWHALREKGVFWIVTRHKVSISRLPRLGETVTVKTWPMPTTRVTYPRCVRAFDSQGKELFTCLTLWALMDLNNRTLVLPAKSSVQVDGITLGDEPELPTSIPPRPLANSMPHLISREELDLNGHVNNARYLDWVQSLPEAAFPAGRSVKAFTVCYLAETLEGQLMDLRWQRIEENCLQMDAHRRRTDVPDTTDRVLSVQLFFE